MPYLKKKIEPFGLYDRTVWIPRPLNHWQRIITTVKGGRYDIGDKETTEPAYTIFSP